MVRIALLFLLTCHVVRSSSTVPSSTTSSLFCKNFTHKMKTAVAATLIASAAAFAPQSVSSIESFADGAGVGVLSNGFA